MDEPGSKTVDSYRFIDRITRQVLKAWVAREPRRDIPWTPLARPLGQARVAALSSAGVALTTDRPFDQEGERNNPWWGDPTHRLLPRTTTAADVGIYHLHINPRPAAEDLDCVLPLRRLLELEEAGVIGSSAPTHYSIMGFLLRTETLITDTMPQIIARMQAEEVDVALLVPV